MDTLNIVAWLVIGGLAGLIAAVVTERETADALLRADAYLSTQPLERNVEKGHFGDSGAVAESEVFSPQQRLAEAGGNRTHRRRD